MTFLQTDNNIKANVANRVPLKGPSWKKHKGPIWEVNKHKGLKVKFNQIL